MVEAVVEYNYTASEPDELTIAKGDVIREIVKKPGGWWEGTLRDKRGMFPDNFVTVIQKEHKASIRQQHKQKALRQCRAIFSYNPAHDDELKLNFGDLIDVLCEVEEGWWKGRLGHFEGVFPSNFVEEIEKSSSSKEDLASLSSDLGTPNLPPKPTKIICQAKYPYDACNDDELTLKEGDRITLINKDGQDRGWWRGELHGRVGVFPDNFVVVLPAAEQNGSPHVVGKDKKHSDTGGAASARKSVSPHDETKHTNVASQRKSLELKTDDHRTPPLPGKKPNVPKKSPSSAGSVGVLAGLKHKLVDRVDGIASSRLPTADTKTEDGDVDFDQVERSAMLPDMRANRAKAPGRRPPSVVYRDTEQPNLVNGNVEHSQPSSLAEITTDEDDEKKQPKVREWEKHKAPWVDELKLLNQGKRPTSDQSRLKPIESETHETKQKSPSSSLQQQQQSESSTVDMSKSMTALTKLKLPTPDASASEKSPTNVPLLRTKPPAQSQPITIPARPQSIHGVTNLAEPSRLSVSPSSQTPSPKPPVAEKDPVKLTSSPRSSIDKKLEVVTMRQYLELQERILQMEAKMSQQYQQMQGTIDELKVKLQMETDMRRLLQSELEKVAQCVTQV